MGIAILEELMSNPTPEALGNLETSPMTNRWSLEKRTRHEELKPKHEMNEISLFQMGDLVPAHLFEGFIQIKGNERPKKHLGFKKETLCWETTKK